MATGDKHYGIWWTDPNGSTFDYGGTLGGYSEFNTFLINWDGVTNPPEVECNNGYNAVWLYDNEEDTTGVTTHNNTTYYGWGTTISSGANKIYRIVTTANYTDVDIAFKSDGTIQVFNSDYERVGDDFYINIGVVPKYLSKLSNGTDTYVLKDSEARTSISTIQNNLVTSVSSASTDSQYPSAKCVYDISQQIESLLHDLNSGSAVEMHNLTFTITGARGYGAWESITVNDVTYSYTEFTYDSSAYTYTLILEFESGTSIVWSIDEGKGMCVPNSGQLTLTTDTVVPIEYSR